MRDPNPFVEADMLRAERDEAVRDHEAAVERLSRSQELGRAQLAEVERLKTKAEGALSAYRSALESHAEQVRKRLAAEAQRDKFAAALRHIEQAELDGEADNAAYLQHIARAALAEVTP